VLARAIIEEGFKKVAAGASAIELKRGLYRALAAVEAELKKLSRPVESRRERAQVATPSGHGDQELGELVANAMEKVGREGVVSVEEAKGTETVLEVVEGMRFDRGYVSPYFVTDSQKMEAELSEPLILIHEKKISSMRDLLPLLERVAQLGRSLVIVADDVDGEARATLVVNRLRGSLACCAVKAPRFGDRRKAMLEDIAVVTGGRCIVGEIGVKLRRPARGGHRRSDQGRAGGAGARDLREQRVAVDGSDAHRAARAARARPVAERGLATRCRAATGARR
jgi:chaperonin GroEL